MSFFRKTTPAPTPRSKDATTVATFYAALLTVMLVAQLFAFEGFVKHLNEFGLPGGDVTAYLTAAVVVVSELFALPFLLRMPLSPAFRWVSMVSGWGAALAWVILATWQQVNHPLAETVGFFGTAITVVPGWWAVWVAVALGLLAAWAAWGMWPGKRRKK